MVEVDALVEGLVELPALRRCCCVANGFGVFELVEYLVQARDGGFVVVFDAYVGDLIQTRRNDTELGVANRETWTVIETHQDGSATLKGGIGGKLIRLPVAYLADHAHLAYASTIHGAQGRTVDHALAILDDMTDRASLYVAATRGRYSNTIHAVGLNRNEIADLLTDAISRHRPETWDAIEGEAKRAVKADKLARAAAAREALRQRARALRIPAGSGEQMLPPLAPPERGPIGL